MSDVWHAVCRDCPFEEVGEFRDVASAAREHEDETDHSVTGEVKVDDAA